MRRIRQISVILGLAMVTMGCTDYELPLPHRYLLARISAGQFVIVSPDRHPVVGPTVTEYLVSGDIVAGRVSPQNAPPSYFIVDTHTRTAQSDLTRTVWITELTTRGVRDITTRRPSRFNPWLSR